ncbi:M23 family metallopeptidase [Alteribacter natronophilus]|uniref:M23 family metallopeptidase n=1 Tax=Alteribacter natronophilus TaxID=2583810 RepID=UPI00110D3504|nr:M23 family metallopeptidase [Alteribacter natronophilus]TMW73035.1 M23 family peptidase [Alteribacter natronophilus]
MKRIILLAAVPLVLAGCQHQEGEAGQDPDEILDYDTDEHTAEAEREQEEPDFILDVYTVDELEVISPVELAEKTGGSVSYDEIHRTLEMTVGGSRYYLVYGVPVLEQNGIYLDTDEVFIVLDEKEKTPYLPVSFLEYGLGAEFNLENERAEVFPNGEAVAAMAAPDETFDLHSKTVEEMIDYLSFLDYPIKGAEVSTQASHLPGAPRDYRNGYHEGVDWYDWTTYAVINTDTPIYGMGEGTVVRVDHGYEEFESPEARNQRLSITYELGFTPEYLLDKLRGQQVWVQYDNGVMNRFAHLDDIPEDLSLGDRVDAETVIGFVGNSGTSGAVNQDGSGLHLHHDLLVYGDFFWEPFTLEETREILQEIWGPQG